MKFGDILYIIAMILFAWITFGIVRGNFQRKFDEEGRRKDLVDSDRDPNEKIENRNEKSSGKEENAGK